MAPATAASQNASDRLGESPHCRPLNAFMAFRSFYNRMLPNMQQKDRSGVLTSLWSVDPYKNQWTMMAKVYSFLRAELGKDSVSLPSFLEHACNVLRVPPLDSYLQQQGFALLENESGSLSLIPEANLAKSSDTPEAGRSSDGKTMGSHQDGPATTTESSGFRDFKDRNKENIDAATSAFLEVEGQQSSIKNATFGNEKAAASLYAEHELLQAVFDRGLEIDPEHQSKTETIDNQKQWLVQKLYSMAYEMLIGGEFPIIVGTEGFSHTIKHNPIAAAAQLFSRDKTFEFDVLVVDKKDRVKNHVFCKVNPEGGDKAVVLPTSGQQTADAQATAGPFYAGTLQPELDNMDDGNGDEERTIGNLTPTYTQKMTYQSPESGGSFHVFSSQPSTLGNSIVTNSGDANSNTTADASSFNATYGVQTGKNGTSSSSASFAGQGSTDGSISSPVDLEADTRHSKYVGADTSDEMGWLHADSTSHGYCHNNNDEDDENDNVGDMQTPGENTDNSNSARCLSMNCALDTETIVTSDHHKNNFAWFGAGFGTAVSGPSGDIGNTINMDYIGNGFDIGGPSNYHGSDKDDTRSLGNAFAAATPLTAHTATTATTAPGHSFSDSLNIARSSSSGSMSSSHLGKRSRDNNDIDGNEDGNQPHTRQTGQTSHHSEADSRARSNKKTRGRLHQDMDFLLNTMGQNRAELHAQLARRNRPIVFDQIYRSQIAQRMDMMSTSSGPMLPSMAVSMQSIPSVPRTTAADGNAFANDSTAALLNYSFPTTLPNIHNPEPANISVADFFAMQEAAASGPMVDITDPAALDRFLGYTMEDDMPGQSTTAGNMSVFDWSQH